MVLPDKTTCYRALESRDARFDGVLYVAVRSTGIYCRPICPARTPKFQNCDFYGSAAAAQDAGFRPCLRCRPEAAPDLMLWRGTSNTVSRALALIAEGALDGDVSVDKLAGRLGIGERQLRRLFLQHLGASPISIAQTRRVLFAKQLLHETKMPIADVAIAAGFGSVRRFNEVFQRLFKRAPGAIRRKKATEDEKASEAVVLRLAYKAPYDWDSILDFLRARAIPEVEVVEGGRYFRTVEIEGSIGSIEVSHEPKRCSIALKISFPDVRQYPAIVSRVRRLFDIGADIETIDAHLAADPLLAPLVKKHPGLRAPGGWDGFELAVRAVLGQQISVDAARKLAGQLVALHGKKVPTKHVLHANLSRAFPSATLLVKAPSLGLGMPVARLATLKAVAEASVADPNLFRPLGSVDEVVEKLKGIRGVGDWTAQYIALRAIREMDAFPAMDIGLLRGAAAIDQESARDAKRLLDRAEVWRPWRSYAAQHLWSVASTRQVISN